MEISASGCNFFSKTKRPLALACELRALSMRPLDVNHCSSLTLRGKSGLWGSKLMDPSGAYDYDEAEWQC